MKLGPVFKSLEHASQFVSLLVEKLGGRVELDATFVNKSLTSGGATLYCEVEEGTETVVFEVLPGHPYGAPTSTFGSDEEADPAPYPRLRDSPNPAAS